MKKLILLITLMLSIPCNGFAAAAVHAADADKASVISEAAERYIDTKNAELSKKCGASIIIATVKSTGELSMSEYAQSLSKAYRLNSGEKSNSVLILFCIEKKDYTVIVADGISASLTAKEAEKFLAEYAEKDFAKKNYTKSAIKTYNGIASWYNENYTNLKISLSDDISEYEAAVENEHIQEHRHALNRKIILTVTIITLLVILLYTKRRMRLIKARKKRNERKLRYMRGIRNG